MTANDIQKIRRENLRRLVEQHGATALAKRLGHSGPSYLSQLAGRGAKHHRAIGEKTARDIEMKLGLERGELDRLPGTGDGKAFSGTDRTILVDTMRAVGEALECAGVKPGTAQYVKIAPNMVAEVYERSVPIGRVDQDYLKRLIDLLA